MADTNPQFIRLGLRRRGRSTRLRMRWDRSPLTCATVASMLPVEEQVYHAKYANNEIYNLVPLPKPKPPQEWACLYPGPGDLLFVPVSSRLTGSFAGGNTLSEQKLEVDEEGWLLDFAFFYERGNSLIGPYGIGRARCSRPVPRSRSSRILPMPAATSGSRARWARPCTSSPLEIKLPAWSGGEDTVMADKILRDTLLGLIIPSIRSADVELIHDPETRHYDRWMRQFGIPGIRTLEAYTEANGRHDVESVFDTGREDKLVAATRELADAGCAAVAWPCTCASFIGGLAWSQRQAEAMKKASGLPVTSTSLAMLEAVNAHLAPIPSMWSARTRRRPPTGSSAF